MKNYLFNEREVCDNAELHGVLGSSLDQQARRDGLVVSMRELTIVKRSITATARSEQRVAHINPRTPGEQFNDDYRQHHQN